MTPLGLGAGLFPASVVARAGCFDAATDSDPDFAGLRLPAALASAVTKRRAEHLAGRACARDALRALLPDLADLGVPVGPGREPVWPSGVVGSIAHAKGVALAAVARADEVRGLGVDVEGWLDAEAPARLGSHLAHAGEIDALAASIGWTRERALTLIFTVKESVFKCLYADVRHVFGFHAARVTRAREAEGALGDFVVELCEDVGPFPAGLVLSGRFEARASALVTAIVRAP